MEIVIDFTISFYLKPLSFKSKVRTKMTNNQNFFKKSKETRSQRSSHFTTIEESLYLRDYFVI